MKKGLYGLVIGAAVAGMASPAYASHERGNGRLGLLPDAVQQVYKKAGTCSDVSATTLSSLPKPKMSLDFYMMRESEATKERPIIFNYSSKTTSPSKLALTEELRNSAKKYRAQNPRLFSGMSSLMERNASRLGTDRYTIQISSDLVDAYGKKMTGLRRGRTSTLNLLDLTKAKFTGGWKCVDIPNPRQVISNIRNDYDRLGEEGFDKKHDAKSLTPFYLSREMIPGKKFILVYELNKAK